MESMGVTHKYLYKKEDMIGYWSSGFCIKGRSALMDCIPFPSLSWKRNIIAEVLSE